MTPPRLTAGLDRCTPGRVRSSIGDVDRSVRAELDPGGDLLQHVALRLKPAPDHEDHQRGRLEEMAYYYGTALEQGEMGRIELPDPSPPVGEVVLFLDCLAPLTRSRIEVVLRHEYHHALGYTEDEIRGMGLMLSEDLLCGP